MTTLVQYLATGLATGCGYALVATGFVAIYRVTRVVNFAQGAFAVVAALAAHSLLARGLPHGAAEAGGILAAMAAGLLVGLVAVGRRGTPVLASLIITIGLGVLAYAVEILLWGDQPISYEQLRGAIEVGALRLQRQDLLVGGVTVATFAALSVFFARTYLGKGLTACSSNPLAARLVGIDVRQMAIAAFILAGALGGLAGVLLTPLRSISFDSDVELAINGFAAAVFGGLVRPGLALAGGVVLGLAEALVAGYVSSALQVEVALALMLAIMVSRSGGAREVE